MTIGQIKSQVQSMYRNDYSDAIITSWIDRLDRTIFNEVVKTHYGAAEDFDGYNVDTDADTVLLAPAPYDDIYMYYIMMNIDIMNSEAERAQNDAMLFKEAYQSFVDHYNRTYMPTLKIKEFKL